MSGWVCVILGFSEKTIAADTIKIAAIFAKSGDAQTTDVYCLRGVNLAVEHLNAQGGVLGHHIQVLELDNKSNALASKMAAQQAIQAGVTAVIGASWSSHSLAIAPVLQQAGIPMISPISTNPKVTPQGNYIFRVCFTDPFQGRIMAQFARQDLHAETAVILTNINSDYSVGLSQFFKESFLQSDGKVLLEEKYLENAIDFTEILHQIQLLPPDVIFVPGYPRDSGFLLKQARKMGIQSIFLGGDGWNATMYEFAGSATDGNYFSNHWHKDVSSSLSKRILEDYLQTYGEDSVIAKVPLAYDAVLVLADAIRRAQSLDRSKIRDALAATTNMQGATGTLTFDKNGDPENKEAAILKFEKGTVVFVKSVKP